MKILFINSLPPYGACMAGGAEKTINGQMSAVQAAGANVSILNLGEVDHLIKETEKGVNRWTAPLRNLYFVYGKNQKGKLSRAIWHSIDTYNPLMKAYISKVIAEEKPDIVSMHNLAGWSISAWDAIAACKVPIVQVLHDQYLLCPRSTMHSGNEVCMGQCLICRILRLPHRRKSEIITGVVGVSQFILDKFLALGYFKNATVMESIHNVRSFPVDLSAIHPRAADGNIVFGYIGTLAKNKGIEVLLETFTRKATPNWRLKIAGVGRDDYSAPLKAKYASDQRISFLGYMTQQDFFTQVDITVVPSLCEEALCCVVFESHMFGVPTVGSNFGGIPEMIIPGINGEFCDPKIAGDLYRAMTAVVKDLNKYRSDVKSVMETAIPHSDPVAWARTWVGVYERSLSAYHGKCICDHSNEIFNRTQVQHSKDI